MALIEPSCTIIDTHALRVEKVYGHGTLPLRAAGLLCLPTASAISAREIDKNPELEESASPVKTCARSSDSSQYLSPNQWSLLRATLQRLIINRLVESKRRAFKETSI